MTGAYIADGLVLAATYSLLGLSWVIVFRATGVWNLATGQFMSLGAYVLFAALVQQHFAFVPGLLVTLLVLAVFSGLTFYLFVRPIQGQPAFVVVVLTIGWSIVIEGAIAIIWGPDVKVLPSPVVNEIYTLPQNARLTTYDIATIVAAAVLVVFLVLFFRFTRMGVRMRAASESPTLASQSGVNIYGLFFVGWGIAGIAAALGGISYGYTDIVSPSVAAIGLYGLAPALLGGFESILGTAIGACLIAAVQVLGDHYLGGNSEEAMIFGVMLVVLLVKPEGLFTAKAVQRV